MGLKTQTGKKLAKSQFHYIFKNPFYYGHFLWNDELYEGKHEVMISKQEFDIAQKLSPVSINRALITAYFHLLV